MEKSVRCVCIGGEHYLHFTTDEHQIYVDINAKIKMPLKFRLKEAWKLLKGKEACGDGIILDKEKSLEIAEFLTDYWLKQEKVK